MHLLVPLCSVSSFSVLCFLFFFHKMNMDSPSRRKPTPNIMPTISPVFFALVFDPMPPEKNELIISEKTRMHWLPLQHKICTFSSDMKIAMEQINKKGHLWILFLYIPLSNCKGQSMQLRPYESILKGPDLLLIPTGPLIVEIGGQDTKKPDPKSFYVLTDYLVKKKPASVSIQN